MGLWFNAAVAGTPILAGFARYETVAYGDAVEPTLKRLVSNVVKNVVEKEKNRKRFLSPASVHVDLVLTRREQEHDGTIIENFRKFLQTRLGDLAVAIFDARLEGRQTKDLVGLPELDRPSRYVVKRVVQEIKTAAREYAQRLDDPDFLYRVERLLGRDGGGNGRPKDRDHETVAGGKFLKLPC